jgi:hypothetical protein
MPGIEAAKVGAMNAEAPAGEPADLDALADSTANGQPSDSVVALQDSLEQPRALMAPLASSSEGAAPAAASVPIGLAMGGGGAEGLRGGAMYRFGEQAGTGDEARRALQVPAATVTLRLATPEGALRFKTLLAESEIVPAEAVDRRQNFFGGQSLQNSRSEGGEAGGEQAAEEAQLDAADKGATSERSHYFFFSELKPEGADGAAATRLDGEVRRGAKLKESLENQVWVEATPAQLDALLLKCQNAEEAFAAVVVDEEAPLAKRAARTQSELELKRQTLKVPQEAPAPSSNAASGPRELVLFVLQPPAELPAAEAAEAAPAK